MPKHLQNTTPELQAEFDKAIDQVLNKHNDYSLSKAITSIDEENRTATFVLSTVDIDRHGHVVEQKSWQLDKFKTNPVFLEQHKADEYPIGTFVKLEFEVDPNNPGENRLVGTVKFADDYDRADIAWNLVKQGVVRTVSVGFIPHDWDYDEDLEVFVLKDCELVEVSLVSVPSNYMALVKTKAAAVQKGISFGDFFEIKANPNKDKAQAEDELKTKTKETAKTAVDYITAFPDDPKIAAKQRAMEQLQKALRVLQ
jgi:HK97 family phage prohead protease